MSSSPWQHPMCEACWFQKNGDARPLVVVKSKWEKCCFCWGWTHAGIYVHLDPELLSCKGNHYEVPQS